jgi:hypothetical protein
LNCLGIGCKQGLLLLDEHGPQWVLRYLLRLEHHPVSGTVLLWHRVADLLLCCMIAGLLL